MFIIRIDLDAFFFAYANHMKHNKLLSPTLNEMKLQDPLHNRCRYSMILKIILGQVNVLNIIHVSYVLFATILAPNTRKTRICFV